MSEAATAPKSKYWNEDKKKFVISTQLKDESGTSIGPLQYFEDDTIEGLLEKKDAAHQNAAVKLYETRRAVKLGDMLEPDPDNEPLYTYEERPLTADERVKIQKMMSDPATAPEASRLLLEAQLGAPIEAVRTELRDRQVEKRVNQIQTEIAAFVAVTPEYVNCEHNRDAIEKYMAKKEYKWTRKNLKIAFEDLSADSLLVVQAPKAAAPVTPAPQEPNAPAVAPAIPASPTTLATVIPNEPTDVRPAQSLSGLGRSNSSAVPGAPAPKTNKITIRDINKMTASQYETFLRDPENRKLVDELYAKK